MDRKEFITLMTHSDDQSNMFCSLAGCDVLPVKEDWVTHKGGVFPFCGDWVVVYDQRSHSGAYGFNHEDFYIVKVKLEHPEKYGIDESLKTKRRKANAMELMYRYQWISGLFSSWDHLGCKTPFSHREDERKLGEVIDDAYTKEKRSLAKDPHLALYWLLHFGLALDKRYAEVADLVAEHKLAEQLPVIAGALDFFANSDWQTDVPLYAWEEEKKAELSDMFLKRRAHLVRR